jgi:hypothetical protein
MTNILSLIKNKKNYRLKVESFTSSEELQGGVQEQNLQQTSLFDKLPKFGGEYIPAAFATLTAISAIPVFSAQKAEAFPAQINVETQSSGENPEYGTCWSDVIELTPTNKIARIITLLHCVKNLDEGETDRVISGTYESFLSSYDAKVTFTGKSYRFLDKLPYVDGSDVHEDNILILNKEGQFIRFNKARPGASGSILIAFNIVDGKIVPYGRIPVLMANIIAAKGQDLTKKATIPNIKGSGIFIPKQFQHNELTKNRI